MGLCIVHIIYIHLHIIIPIMRTLYCPQISSLLSGRSFSTASPHSGNIPDATGPHRRWLRPRPRSGRRGNGVQLGGGVKRSIGSRGQRNEEEPLNH